MNELIGGKPKLYDNISRPKLNELVIQTRKAKYNHATAAPNASDDDEADAAGSDEEAEESVPLTGASFRVGGDDRIRVLSVIFNESMRGHLLEMETQGTRQQLDEGKVGGAPETDGSFRMA